MTEEDRKGIARECRKSIISALRDIDDIKFLRRIYISILLTRGDMHNSYTRRVDGKGRQHDCIV